ncbi:hypothetical protein N431DRAFT_400117 [Stipitochalara longipes BDJ]|nr:hypothetical protein N431DRAFT_400117 [Stipitochalara longipes BDJ]
MTSFNNETWGITKATCYDICGWNTIRQVRLHSQLPLGFFLLTKCVQSVDFGTVANSITVWLLPWIALTAQLPYEADGFSANLMSLLLAVGSPALITFSLAITAFNRRWIRKRFAVSANNLPLKFDSKFSHFKPSVEGAQYLLEKAQQVPLRCSEVEGWLSSLIVLPQNRHWWTGVMEDLTKTRRDVTFSLIAQLLFAVLAYIFTVIEAFPQSGSLTTATQMSASGLWAWMVPICAGWVFVGTQINADTAAQALRRTPAQKTLNGPEQRQPAKIANHEDPHWLGRSVAGDEQKEGPIFNYARFITWWWVADTIERCFAVTAENLHLESPVSGKQWDHSKRINVNLSGTVEELEAYCGLTPNRQDRRFAYIGFSQVDSAVWMRVLSAAVVAIIIQWGTTGPSIIIAFLTPTVGLGCRSGSYLIYGCAATLSWLILLTSVFVSHAAMLREQNRLQCSSPAERSIGQVILERVAVATRVIGKWIAVINAMWILGSSLMEYLGIYENCWCDSSDLSLGEARGYVTLFPSSLEIAQQAVTKGYLAGGVAFSILVFGLASLFFLFASWPLR